MALAITLPLNLQNHALEQNSVKLLNFEQQDLESFFCLFKDPRKYRSTKWDMMNVLNGASGKLRAVSFLKYCTKGLDKKFKKAEEDLRI